MKTRWRVVVAGLMVGVGLMVGCCMVMWVAGEQYGGLGVAAAVAGIAVWMLAIWTLLASAK